VIFRYLIPDGLGNTLRLIVQALDRDSADRLARNHGESRDGRTNKTYKWDFSGAEVTDLSDRAVVDREIFDHELGEWS
jgi:hypothetical protein